MYNFNTIKDNKDVNICAKDLNLSNWTRFMKSSLGNDNIKNVTVITCDNNETDIKKMEKKLFLMAVLYFMQKKIYLLVKNYYLIMV
jgi:hypothetical protein